MTFYHRRLSAVAVVTFAGIALSNCSDRQGEGPIEGGIYTATQADGSQSRLVVSAQGTYSEMEDNVPQPVDQGEWTRSDGKFCMISSVEKLEICFDEIENEADGTITLSTPDTAITLVKETLGG